MTIEKKKSVEKKESAMIGKLISLRICLHVFVNLFYSIIYLHLDIKKRVK